MAGWQPSGFIPMRFYGLEKRTWQFSWARMRLDSAGLPARTIHKKTFSHTFFGAEERINIRRQLSIIGFDFSLSLAEQRQKKSNIPYHANIHQIKKRAAPEVRMAGWQRNGFIPMRFYGLLKTHGKSLEYECGQIARGSLRGQYKKTFSHAFFEAEETHWYMHAAFNNWFWLVISCLWQTKAEKYRSKPC